ncbi:MAG TPA: nicotinate-nucleotide adenylyltransferase, partial [Chthonomonadales bacterium]|nr:nicotinate-nucleotide adenylyltransferase [Chthonomonadales bacterium]
MRLGIIGGTFDPIHYGHLFIAEDARVQLRLDSVVFVPAGIPPHKETPVASPRHRLEISQIALQGNDRFSCSSIEIHRSGPSYTIDTLRTLHERDPRAELYYISGIDAAADL